jgi:hypothetical protein
VVDRDGWVSELFDGESTKVTSGQDLADFISLPIS